MDEIQKSLSDKRLSQRQHIFNSFSNSAELETKEEIQKARSGIYADTAENRKLSRVGQRFGNPSKKIHDNETAPRKIFDSIDDMYQFMKDESKGTLYILTSFNHAIRADAHMIEQKMRANTKTGRISVFDIKGKNGGYSIEGDNMHDVDIISHYGLSKMKGVDMYSKPEWELSKFK